ncbi:DUF5312 family protein [uncultured Treponema sp.]|uniref:DUF5312 family protein n=1 Tax=uncultured Treponema sp. TaxID=162155 RepID=UPI0015B7DCB4|nr:DUF5312 family protein [uncultured Treponema sp.]
MERNSFDALVSGLSETERVTMLEKMKAAGADNSSLAVSDSSESAPPVPVEEQIKQEPFLFRVFLWIKSIFANTSMQVLYNEHRIAQIARSVEKNSPNLMDSKRNMLMSGFYDKLVELKLSADFFRPYMLLSEADENSFLVFLGSLIMSDIEEQMNESVDPYSLPFENGQKPEQRMNLLRRMDEILNSIPTARRNYMYEAVRSYEWLKQFSKLPFERFISLFSTVVEKNYSCAFSTLENEVSVFAKILCNGVKIYEEVLEALYLFSRKGTSGRSLDSMDEVAEKAADFMEKSKSQISMMRMFINTVPLKSIARIIYSDAAWVPENFTGGEDWYVRYKNHWRRLFEEKWKSWGIDCKKEQLKQGLERNFGLENFPLLPERPWALLWGGMPFRYELTAGFLNWYLKEKFPEYELPLKTIMLEGDFIKKENRAEFNDSFNKLIQVSVDLQTLNRVLSSGGEYGMIFNKLHNENLRSLQAHSKIESIIRGVESDVRSMILSFCDACRTLENCFTGIFLEKTDSRYDALTNLARLGGKNNDIFVKKLEEARRSISDCYALIRELEPIDTPSLAK